jgi:hypothetical protein
MMNCKNMRQLALKKFQKIKDGSGGKSKNQISKS